MTARFELEVTGQILTGSFPYSVSATTLSYSVLPANQDDWSHDSGEASGISPKSHSSTNQFVYNLPISCGFSSSTPFGWPRFVVTVFESDWRGRDVILGYGTTVVPSQPGRHSREVWLFAPAAKSWWEQLVNWVSGQRPMLTNPLTFLTRSQPNRDKVITVPSYSSIRVEFNISITNAEKLNLHFGYRYFLSWNPKSLSGNAQDILQGAVQLRLC